MALFMDALGITVSSQPDAYPAEVCAVDCNVRQVSADPPSKSPLSPRDEVSTVRMESSTVQHQNGTNANVEENKDPNTAEILIDSKTKDTKADGDSGVANMKVRPPPSAKTPPASAQNKAADVLASVDSKEMQTRHRLDSSPRHPPNSWYNSSVVSPTETWVRLDSMRVRMEMLPGGLVIERDSNLTELGVLMGEMQSGECEASDQVPQSQAYLKHASILTKITWLADLVEAVESEYWRWCQDEDAPPLDMVAKQQVYDWLVHTGEKAVVLAQLRELGARRCLGLGNALAGTGRTCPKFIQYGLYKSKVRRCPACIKESKRLIALHATEAVRAEGEEVDVKNTSVAISEAPASSIPVEARDLAFAIYAACPDTYFRAYLLPSDLEIAKANGTPVMVSWLDGDRKHRSVPATDVVMMDHPSASDVRTANAAHWDEDSQCLVPRTAGK